MGSYRTVDDDLGFLLARASAVMVKASNEALAPLGLKVRAYSVLAVVCDESDGVTQRKLADDVGLDPSQIVALVDALEGRELVLRTADPNDRRNKLVIATRRGRTLYQRAQKYTAGVAAHHTANFKPQVVDQVRKLLSQIVFPDFGEQLPAHREQCQPGPG